MASTWLPDELLHSILEKLVSISDCVRFSLVCKQWRFVALEHFRGKGLMNRSAILHRQQLPLLMVPAKDDNEEKRSLYSITEQKVYECRLSVPYDRRCCGSSHGWLITVGRTLAVSLLNPFSGAVIRLPPILAGIFDHISAPIPWYNDEYNHYDARGDEYIIDDDVVDDNRIIEDGEDIVYVDIEDDEDINDVAGEDNYGDDRYPYAILKAVLSKDPNLYPDDYVVFVIFGSVNRLAFIRSGDKEWTYIDPEFKCFSDIIYYQDKFYALQYYGKLIACDVNESIPKLEKIVPGNFRNINRDAKSYLVELPKGSGELRMVVRFFNGTSDAYMTNGFSVLKLQVTDKETKWVKTFTLGDDVALFLGDNYSTTVSASDFPGCQPDCIYFTDDFYNFFIDGPSRFDHDGRVPCDVGFFNLKDKRFGKNYIPDPAHDYTMRPPIWIVPKFNYS